MTALRYLDRHLFERKKVLELASEPPGRPTPRCFGSAVADHQPREVALPGFLGSGGVRPPPRAYTGPMPAKALSSALAIMLICSLSSVLAGCGGSAGASQDASVLAATGNDIGRSSATASTPFRFFASSSFWNKPLSANAPLDPSSAARMRAFVEQIDVEEQSDDGPWINTTKSGVPVYTVPANQPTVPVQLVNHVPEPALSAAWSAVPLPPTAQPASGHDGDLVIWQPSTDRLWEFDHMIHEGDGWQAEWGGAMRHVLSSAGVYGSRAWPGAHHWWGMSASSLSLVGGLIFIQDLELGQINHALEMSLPERAATIYASPAQRTDGESTNPLALPEGAHLRLNPKLNLAALHLPRLTLILAEAAQRYGIFVTDGTGISGATTFFAQEPAPGDNPYTGPDGYFEGKRPNQLLASFPWSELQLLKMEVHKKK
jgi:hypothetical protein